jgi:SulP family sulfate permease
VGIVALPLSMAFGIASGVDPGQGLVTAIVAGFLISALGGSNVQVGGPAGAFIVVVYGIVQRHGLTNLLIATALAGGLLFLMGWLKLGALVRYIPVSIVVGFTNAIAVLIAVSQLKDLLGLSLANVPAEVVPQLEAIAAHAAGTNPWAVGMGVATFAGLVLWPRLFARGAVVEQGLEGRSPRLVAEGLARVPGPMVAILSMSVFAALFAWPVETIGTRFGGIPQGLPALALPPFTWASARELVAPTLTIALLGAIESLLCARIADHMVADRPGPPLPRHDPNQELMAQGIANMVVPAFGGIPATGTISRTVTNIRTGATTPVAGIVHALVLLVIVLAAAPLASAVPLPALAGLLLFVAWNMGEWHAFRGLGRFPLTYRVVMLGTFALTVLVDLTVAVQVGLVLACVSFIVRSGRLFRVGEVPAPAGGWPAGVHVFECVGSLFFGAVAKVEELPDAVPCGTHALVLDAHRLVQLDSTGLAALRHLHRTLARQGTALVFAGVAEQPLALFQRSGFAAEVGAERLRPGVESALELARGLAPDPR